MAVEKFLNFLFLILTSPFQDPKKHSARISNVNR